MQTNNSVRHLHFHIIPRYRNPVSFCGEVFSDENFNGMPIEQARLLSAECMAELVGVIKSRVENERETIA